MGKEIMMELDTIYRIGGESSVMVVKFKLYLWII
jgi:hypothetical protein